jgi:ATP-binding cassette subfamily C protein LapB
MLMDEPSNAMDQITEAKLLTSLKRNLQNKTSLIVTQKMTILKIVDRVIVMNEGRIFVDAPKEDALKKLQGGGKKIES